MHLTDDQSTVQDNHSNNHNEEYHTPINNTNDHEDKNQDESDRPLQLKSKELNKTVNQGYKILLPVGPSKSTSISTKHNEKTSTNPFPQDILCQFYKGISTIVHILLFLLVSLWNGILQASLLVSLQSDSILASSLTFLWNIFLRRLYKYISTIIRIQVKPRTYSYNHLYENISSVTSIHIKSEITKS